MNKRIYVLFRIFLKETLKNKTDLLFNLVMPLFLLLFLRYGLILEIRNFFNLFITITLMSGIVVSCVWDFGRYRHQGLQRKVATTPTHSYEWMYAIFISKLITSLLSITLLIGFIKWVLHESLPVNWLYFYFFIICGAISMLGISQLVLFVFRGLQASINGSSVMIGCMLFLGGSWSKEFLGDYQWISKLVPSKYILDGIYSTTYNLTLSTNTLIGGFATLLFGILTFIILTPKIAQINT